MIIKKICTSCQMPRNPDDGEIRKGNKITRWVCKFCLSKTNQSIYSSKKNRRDE